MKRELQELGYAESATTDDIFGHQKGNTVSEGLVDSADESDFESKLEVVKVCWMEIEKCCGAKPGFYSWFIQNKANMMKNTMLKSVQIEAGLGSPPQSFTTNASETSNSVIKAHVSYKHSQLMEFVNHLKDVVDEQEREVERAVIKRGKHRFKEIHSYLEVKESQWFSMTPVQREAHLKKVASVRITNNSITSDLSSITQALSIDVSEVAASTNVPLPCLQGIWSKPTKLLQPHMDGSKPQWSASSLSDAG